MPDRRAINNRLNTLYPAQETDFSGSVRWSSAATRQDRYAILQAFSNLTIYTGEYADSIKRDFRAYKKIRPIAAPFATIANFHAGHLLGPDPLDPDAGPGDPKPSCLPIISGKTARPEAIQKAVAALWEASNWAGRKTRLARYGAVMGDVGIEAVADEARGKVRMDIIHPGQVIEHDPDPYGQTKHVAIEKEVIDPSDPHKIRKCRYKRTMTNEKGVVTVRTFKDDKPYPWPDTPGEEWTYPWGFVPFVLIHHRDIGEDWGGSELQDMLSIGIALDGQESVLNDQTIKSLVMPIWMNYVKAPMENGKPKKIEFNFATQGDERNDHIILYTNVEGADIKPLVYPVPIGESNDRNKRLELIIARDYPELLASDPVGLAASGEARREARKSATSKINDRRTAYDAGLVRIHQMAMTMGYERGFDEYEFQGPWERIFRDGLTDHRIGPRSVFGEDRMEVLAERKAEADAVMAYYDGGQGTTIQWALKRVAVPPDQIEELMDQLAQDEADARQFQSDQFGVVPADEEVPPGLEIVA